jgi:hypothetical protein
LGGTNGRVKVCSRSEKNLHVFHLSQITSKEKLLQSAALGLHDRIHCERSLGAAFSADATVLASQNREAQARLERLQLEIS